MTQKRSNSKTYSNISTILHASCIDNKGNEALQETLLELFDRYVYPHTSDCAIHDDNIAVCDCECFCRY